MVAVPLHRLFILSFNLQSKMEKLNRGAISTVLTLSMSLLIIHFITSRDWPVIASLVLGVGGIVFPWFALKVDYFWKALTKFVGFVIQRLVLILIYYLCLFPIALAARLLRKGNPLQLSDDGSSTYVDAHKSFDKKEFEKPW